MAMTIAVTEIGHVNPILKIRHINSATVLMMIAIIELTPRKKYKKESVINRRASQSVVGG